MADRLKNRQGRCPASARTIRLAGADQVQLELAKWLTREVGEDKSDQVIAFTQLCQIVPLDTEIAHAAAEAERTSWQPPMLSFLPRLALIMLE